MSPGKINNLSSQTLSGQKCLIPQNPGCLKANHLDTESYAQEIKLSFLSTLGLVVKQNYAEVFKMHV